MWFQLPSPARTHEPAFSWRVCFSLKVRIFKSCSFQQAEMHCIRLGPDIYVLSVLLSTPAQVDIGPLIRGPLFLTFLKNYGIIYL